jgi:hypothetical protein
MAITINSTPENYPSAHDDLYFVVTSTNVAQTNFKYVFDILINSVQVTRVKLFPDIATNKGIFNAASVVRNYLSGYFKPNATKTAFSYTGNDIYVTYEVRFGEEYDGTTYTNLTSGSYKAFNFVNPLFRDFSTSYYQPKINTWLTGRDKNLAECGFTEKFYAGWLNTAGTTTSLALLVQKYTESGATDGAYEQGSAVTCNSFVLFDLSPEAINTYLGSAFITASTYQYGVKVLYGGTGSDFMKIKLACNPRWTPITLHFLNQLGGYDSFAFRLVNKQSSQVERKLFNQLQSQYNSGSMTKYDSYKKINGGSYSFNVNQSISYKLTSDYINATNYLWLKDLISSPEVYLEQAGYYYPVAIKSNTWEEKNRVADKMFNFDLNIEFSQKLNSQYR